MSQSHQPQGDGPLRKERIDLQRKVSLKFKEFQGFVTEFSENLSTGGMFIRTNSPQPPGSMFDFEFTLGEDTTLIHGLGEVVWVREEDEGFDRPSGMGVRFLSLDPDSRQLIDQIVARRKERESGASQSLLSPEEGWGMEDAAAEGVESDPGLDFGMDLGGDSEEERTPEPGLDTETGVRGGSEPAPEPSGSPALAMDRGEDRTAAPKRPTGPSPYARSYRSTAGGAQASSSKGRRFVLAGLVTVALVVAALAAAVLFFPDTVMDWLLGGDGGGEEVATRPATGARSGAGAGEVPGVRPDGEAAARPEPRPESPPEPVDEPGSRSDPRAGSEPESDSADRSPSTGVGAGADVDVVAEAPRPAESAPSRDPRAEPEPGTASEPADPAPVPPTPEEERFTRVQNITWQELDDQLLVTIHLDGAVEEWEYSHTRLGVPPPRELIRIRGIREAFPRTTIPVAAGLVERVRTGFHPQRGESEDELHVVLDLESADVVLERSEAGAREIRLYLSREPAGETRER